MLHVCMCVFNTYKASENLLKIPDATNIEDESFLNKCAQLAHHKQVSLKHSSYLH